MGRHPLRLGDRVIITTTPCGTRVGTHGRLTAVDVQADYLEPYHVRDWQGRTVWASTVRRCRLQWPEEWTQPAAGFVLLALAFAVLLL
ncbi:hypothetical protein [Streptomyces sp. NBC_00239]|uniref:hypothetical protein n=1 Tax=Streptomyces sp. NBC_00239 TaxID=2903640 RepID=UPI002E2DD36D|nr:hypothetical protein [Streptomyces sp. NBC_00239]